MHPIGGTRQAQIPVLREVADRCTASSRSRGIARRPVHRCPASSLVHLEHRVGAQFLPVNAVARARHADPLPHRAVLAEVIHVEIRADADRVRVCDRAFVPRPGRTHVENGRGFRMPGTRIRRPGKRDAQMILGSGLVPIPELPVMRQCTAIGCDVASRRGTKYNALLIPVHAVFAGGQRRVPLPVVHGVEIDPADHRRIQRVPKLVAGEHRFGLRQKAKRDDWIATGQSRAG